MTIGLTWNERLEYDLGPDDPMWDERGSFNLEEISYLLYGSAPDPSDPYVHEMIHYEAQKKIKDNVDLMLTSLVSGDFEHSEAKRFKDTYILSKSAIASWFEFLGKPCPDRFKPKGKKKVLPTYLDPDQGNYCPELDLAIKMCEAIYVKKEGEPRESITSRIKNALDKKYVATNGDNLPGGLLIRISAVCNNKPTNYKKKP